MKNLDNKLVILVVAAAGCTITMGIYLRELVKWSSAEQNKNNENHRRELEKERATSEAYRATLNRQLRSIEERNKELETQNQQLRHDYAKCQADLRTQQDIHASTNISALFQRN